METIAHKLEKVINSKAEIKESIESYGVEVGDAPLNEYPQKIDTIEELHPDISWIMEAKVGNHPVVTAEDMRKILSYIAQDYGGYSILRTAPITSVDLSEVTSIGAYGLAIAFGTNSTLTSATFTSLTTINKERALQSAFTACIGLASVSFPALETITGSYACNQMFYNDTALISVSFPELTSISGSYAMAQAFYGCTSLTTISFPNLKTITGSYIFDDCFRHTSNNNTNTIDFITLESIIGEDAFHNFAAGSSSVKSKVEHVSFPKLKTISGARAFSNCMYGSKITSIAFPELETITGYKIMEQFVGYCDSLQSVEFPKLKALTGTSSLRAYTNAFADCSNLKTCIICPKALSSNTSDGYTMSIMCRLPLVQNLTLSEDASNTIYLSWQPLTAASVKNVLEHCNNSNMNGKSVTFKAGLTVTDDAEGSLAALKTAVTAQGCTINNLTINPYSA